VFLLYCRGQGIQTYQLHGQTIGMIWAAGGAVKHLFFHLPSIFRQVKKQILTLASFAPSLFKLPFPDFTFP